MLTTSLLSNSLHFSILELCKLARVLEHFDESVLIEGLFRRFCDCANGINGSLQETLIIKVSGVDVRQLRLGVLGLSLSFLYRRILDRDSLSHQCLVDDDGLLSAKQVEGDSILAVTLHRDVKCREDSEFVFKHFRGNSILHDIHISGALTNFAVKQSQNALRLEQLLDEAHIAGNL